MRKVKARGWLSLSAVLHQHAASPAERSRGATPAEGACVTRGTGGADFPLLRAPLHEAREALRPSFEYVMHGKVWVQLGPLEPYVCIACLPRWEPAVGVLQPGPRRPHGCRPLSKPAHISINSSGVPRAIQCMSFAFSCTVQFLLLITKNLV